MNGLSLAAELVVRPIRDTDRPAVERLFQRLSPESVYRRFFTLFPAPPANILRHLTSVDHGDHQVIHAANSVNSTDTIAGSNIVDTNGDVTSLWRCRR